MRFRDHRGKRREMYLFESKRSSEAFERRTRELIESIQSGEPLTKSLLQWTSTLEPRFRKRFVKWGMLDERRTASSGPIEQLIALWETSLQAKNLTEQHAIQTVQRVREVMAALDVTRWDEIDSLTVQEYLKRRCEGRKGWGVGRHNHHVQSLRQWGKWLKLKKLVAQNRLDDLDTRSKGSEKPRHPRRDATFEEVIALLDATEASSDHLMGLSPKARTLLYHTAALTGLRAGELAEFRVSWINRARLGEHGAPGYLLPDANETKAGKATGRRDPIVLQGALEAELVDHCEGKRLGDKVFPGFRYKRAAAMLRADLARAGIPYQDDAGRFLDFHALRHTFITWAGHSGADPQTHQNLARHSDYRLTAHYSHTRLGSLSRAVESMPHLDGAGRGVTEKSATPQDTPREPHTDGGDLGGISTEGVKTGDEVKRRYLQNPLPNGREGSSPSFGNSQAFEAQGPPEEGADEDNHGAGLARHLWLRVGARVETPCPCKEDEPTTVDGPRLWRP